MEKDVFEELTGVEVTDEEFTDIVEDYEKSGDTAEEFCDRWCALGNDFELFKKRKDVIEAQKQEIKKLKQMLNLQ